MPALDTNFIVRYLTADHPDHSPRARQLFLEIAAGTSLVALREAVLAAAAERDDGVVVSFDRGFDRVSSITRIEP